jgi:DNA mismatch repair ATPase MutL
MASLITLQEHAVRQVISAALRSALAVQQHSWSEEFVTESILGDVTVSSNGSNGTDSHSGTNAASNSNSDINCKDIAMNADANSNDTYRRRDSKRHSKDTRRGNRKVTAGAGSAAALTEITLAPDMADIVDMFRASGDDAAPASPATSTSHTRLKRSSSDGDDQQRQQQQQLLEDIQTRYSVLLYDNYQQVEQEDVAAFCHKLLTDLQQLVLAAAAAADEAAGLQGLCTLCGRDMPLTKHHLIPRDVHKEFKKRGFGFDQLQSGLLVCRPCHSAIHRAVPDNKELAMHYRTLEDLRQHEAISKFSAWASKQRVSSKVDATAKHFRYRK